MNARVVLPDEKEEAREGERERDDSRFRSVGKLHGAWEENNMSSVDAGELAIFDARRDKDTRGSHGGSAKMVRASSSCPPHESSTHRRVYIDRARG